GVFSHAVAGFVFASSPDELLPVFTGVRIEIEDETLSLLATDRYRMALKELPWSPVASSAEGAALVPAKVLSETAKSMTSGESVTVSLANSGIGDGMIGFEGDGNGGTRQITTRLLNGEFPKVRHLMNVNAAVSVRANTADVIASVRRVALVAERNTPLRMVIRDGAIELSAATGDQAQATEALEAVVENHAGGEMMAAVGFNPQYLNDALGALDTPYVYFAFTAPAKPCLIQGLEALDGDPQGDYRHVIMLMRLPN
ncbi:DNA polymerase III subunit beta, partial [Aestuariimicrobium soli]|uniref:DNA polymerase III subunit beta n=1 Tax=Aestuariimicrobium soli TaxID=2035834 RepID=UPI003EB6B976